MGHTARTALDLGLAHAGDDEHLLIAAQNGWILVSHNRKDFNLLHDGWRRWSAAWGVIALHGGILIIPQSWPAKRTASEIDSFIQTGVLLANQLYL